METVERQGSFFRFQLRPFESQPSDLKSGPLLMQRELVFGNTASSEAFLRKFEADPFSVRKLQNVLSRLGAGSPFQEKADGWIERLALHLSSGRISVIEQTPRAPAGESTQGSKSASPPPMAPVPRRSPPPEPIPEQEHATFSTHDTDEQAQVTTLIGAAREGLPFCEVCAKALANA